MPASWQLFSGYFQRLLFSQAGPCGGGVGACRGRVLARPGEMQVGLLTAFVGSPVLLLMVLRMKDRAS